MKNFTPILLIVLLICSCKKENDPPYTNPPSPPRPAPGPVTSVSIHINATAMEITSISFERHGTGAGGGISITASNKFQKVMAVTSPFYQYNAPWSMMYPMEVSYFTRADSSSGWGSTHPRPVPRDDKVYYDGLAPLSDNPLRGQFSGSFIEGVNPTKEERRVNIVGTFCLVF